MNRQSGLSLLASQPVVHLQVLLVMAVVLGGGGIVHGLRHMAIQLASLVVLALHREAVARFVSQGPRGLVVLALASMALPLLQAVPLPAALWQALPGRDLVMQSRGVAGLAADGWMSFSVDPVRTLVAFCSTLVPFAFIAVGSSLDLRDRTRLLLTLAAVALAGLLLGTVQLASANTVAILQDFPADEGFLYAFFSNRNSTAMFFLIALLATAALPMAPGGTRLLLTVTAGGLFALAVVLTQSRTGIVLLLPALLFAAVRFASTRHAQDGKRRGPDRWMLVTGLIALGVVAALGLSLASGGRVADAVSRFETIQTDRLENWEDASGTVARYWPLGAGTGTFDEVFQIDESLEHVSPARAGRVHNDYIEIVIESGLVALVLLLGWWAWCLMAVLARRRDPDRWQAFAGWTALVCIALQSVLDYPLRSEALLALAGLMVALLTPAPKAREDTR